MKGITTSITGLLLLSGCYSYQEVEYNGCFDPITINVSDVRENYPAIASAREVENAGKIYVYDDTLFVQEKGQGLHIINNADKSNQHRVY